MCKGFFLPENVIFRQQNPIRDDFAETIKEKKGYIDEK